MITFNQIIPHTHTPYLQVFNIVRIHRSHATIRSKGPTKKKKEKVLIRTKINYNANRNLNNRSFISSVNKVIGLVPKGKYRKAKYQQRPCIRLCQPKKPDSEVANIYLLAKSLQKLYKCFNSQPLLNAKNKCEVMISKPVVTKDLKNYITKTHSLSDTERDTNFYCIQKIPSYDMITDNVTHQTKSAKPIGTNKKVTNKMNLRFLSKANLKLWQSVKTSQRSVKTQSEPKKCPDIIKKTYPLLSKMDLLPRRPFKIVLKQALPQSGKVTKEALPQSETYPFLLSKMDLLPQRPFKIALKQALPQSEKVTKEALPQSETYPLLLSKMNLLPRRPFKIALKQALPQAEKVTKEALPQSETYQLLLSKMDLLPRRPFKITLKQALPQHDKVTKEALPQSETYPLLLSKVDLLRRQPFKIALKQALPQHEKVTKEALPQSEKVVNQFDSFECNQKLLNDKCHRLQHSDFQLWRSVKLAHKILLSPQDSSNEDLFWTSVKTVKKAASSQTVNERVTNSSKPKESPKIKGKILSVIHPQLLTVKIAKKVPSTQTVDEKLIKQSKIASQTVNEKLIQQSEIASQTVDKNVPKTQKPLNITENGLNKINSNSDPFWTKVKIAKELSSSQSLQTVDEKVLKQSETQKPLNINETILNKNFLQHLSDQTDNEKVTNQFELQMPLQINETSLNEVHSKHFRNSDLFWMSVKIANLPNKVPNQSELQKPVQINKKFFNKVYSKYLSYLDRFWTSVKTAKGASSSQTINEKVTNQSKPQKSPKHFQSNDKILHNVYSKPLSNSDLFWTLSKTATGLSSSPTLHEEVLNQPQPQKPLQIDEKVLNKVYSKYLNTLDLFWTSVQTPKGVSSSQTVIKKITTQSEPQRPCRITENNVYQEFSKCLSKSDLSDLFWTSVKTANGVSSSQTVNEKVTNQSEPQRPCRSNEKDVYREFWKCLSNSDLFWTSVKNANGVSSSQTVNEKVTNPSEPKKSLRINEKFLNTCPHNFSNTELLISSTVKSVQEKDVDEKGANHRQDPIKSAKTTKENFFNNTYLQRVSDKIRNQYLTLCKPERSLKHTDLPVSSKSIRNLYQLHHPEIFLGLQTRQKINRNSGGFRRLIKRKKTQDPVRLKREKCSVVVSYKLPAKIVSHIDKTENCGQKKKALLSGRLLDVGYMLCIFLYSWTIYNLLD